jgi:nucleoside-diphosphate-sugar epimerase
VIRFTVFGATGFIGNALVSRLKQQGIDVFAPSRDMELTDDHLGHVIYCIGLTASYRTRPYDTVHAHVERLSPILKRGNFDSFLYLSSTRLYKGLDHSDESSPILVNPADASDIYNISKALGESLCVSTGKKGVRIARLSNVVGFDQKSSNFLFDIIRSALAGKISLQAPPDSCKDYILVDDVLDMLFQISMRGTSTIYNIASGINISHASICKKIQELTHCEIEYLRIGSEQIFPSIGIEQIQHEFAFSPKNVLNYLPELIGKFRQI